VEDHIPGSANYLWDARWSKLNADLNGRGVENLNSTLQDIFLGELYAPFLECFNHGRIAELTALVIAPLAQKKEAAVFAESFEKPVETLITLALRYLDGAEGRYEPFPLLHAESSASRRTGSGGKAVQPDTKTIQHIVKEFTAYIEVLVTLGKEGKKASAKPAKSDSKTTAEPDAGEAKFLHSLAETIAARPALAVFGLGYGLFRLLRRVLVLAGETGAASTGGADPEKQASIGERACALFEHWGLNRKLAEALAGFGVPPDETWRVIAIMKAILARTGAEAGGKRAAAVNTPALSGAPNAESLLLENYYAEDFRSILKVNFFEDVFWFNKEAFEEALFYVPYLGLLETGTAEAKNIAAITNQFKKAEKASGYKLERLLELFSAKPGKQKKPVKSADPADEKPAKAAQKKDQGGATQGHAIKGRLKK
jgi:hypothetical protein